jgi:hypothetical protein|tara:strand:+ start:2436 stop:3941 length:1506 start_codon:yes stop_codon:yes gene_type:complete
MAEIAAKGYRYQSANERLEMAKETHSKAMDSSDPKVVHELMTQAENLYNSILNKKFDEPILLYFMGLLYCQKGFHGLGALILHRCLETMPELGDAWNNLGICYYREYQIDQAASCFEKAAELLPDGRADIYANMAGLFINRNKPQTCIDWANKALIEEPGHPIGRWNKALGQLELQDWANGWDNYEARLEPRSGCPIALRNYADEPGEMTPWWDGKSDGLVVIHGEQGVGDEVMFATCIPELAEKYPGVEWVVESAPIMHDLLERSFADLPTVTVFGTHHVDGHEWKNGRKVDYKVALGSLPRTIRRKDEDFPGTPILIPSPKLKREFRQKFAKMKDRPKVGIAWQGGVQKTRIDLRSVMPDDLIPILQQDADFISLQYTDDAQRILQEFEKDTGLHLHHWKHGAGPDDMEAKAALISELDLIISVCQSAIHIGGAVGTPTWVMVPSGAAWRYGIKGNMPWYNSVTLKRQLEGDPWAILIGQLAGEFTEWRKGWKGSRDGS